MRTSRSRCTLVTALGIAMLAPGCGRENDETTKPAPAPSTVADGASPAPADGSPQPETIRLPAHWYETDFASWVGRPWRDLDLFRFMPQKPTGLDEGTQYVVFYSRTCEHCEEMFRRDLGTRPELARNVVAVEIPASRRVLTSPDAWPMPATEVREFLALPLSVNWVITPPIAVRLEDGIVRCAQEGDHRPCLGLSADG